MSIKIEYKSFKSLTDKSPEDVAAEELVSRFREDLKKYQNANGTLYVFSSVPLFAQKRRDIDLMIIGHFENFHIDGRFYSKNRGWITGINIKSLIINIELKSHPASKIRRQGATYIVKYNQGEHNASIQCSEAKFSLVNHLQSQLDISCFVTDLLWFDGINGRQLMSLRGSEYDNALCSEFTFREAVQAILYQTEARNINGLNIIDAFPNVVNRYDDIVNLFAAKRSPEGLTKKKFELLSQKSLDINKYIEKVGSQLVILSGRAGTGKTVFLLQVAFSLANEINNNRCVILTYNRALVSDIQRLIDYTPMPSKIDGRTVSIQTIDSFFQSLMRGLGIITSPLNPNDPNYSSLYRTALKSLNELVINQCAAEDISVLKELSNCNIDWDFVLIDEAQDFDDIEKEILFKIYGFNRIVVADGIDQFMRSPHKQTWSRGLVKSDILSPKPMELERRQKMNLVKFLNDFAAMSLLDWRITPNRELPGGEIIICPKYTTDLHIELRKKCKDNDCEPYDILILEPPSMIVKEKGHTHFKNASLYQRCNIMIYDGTNPSNRTTYPIKDECRVYQYDSCRGLEGWCVVCDKFDELIEYKMGQTKLTDDTLGFDKELAKQRIVHLWALMPMTRPIDTLVITLSNPDSAIGRQLRHLANKYEDFVEWRIE